MTGSDPAPTAQATAPGRPDVVLTTLTDDGSAEALLTALRKHPHTEPSPAPGDDYFHLKNWLLATNPGGLLEAALDDGVGIGIGSRTPAGTAHAAVATDRFLVADAPESPALDALRTLIRQWHDHGSPRTHELHGRLERAGDAWRVRLARP